MRRAGVVGLILVGVGCASPLTPTLMPTPTALIVSTAQPPTLTPGQPLDNTSSADRLTDVAIAFAAAELNIPEDDFSLAQQPVFVEWADASLGCPQPGEAYAERITPGYLIILRARGRQVEVHTDTSTNAVLCGDTGTTDADDPIGAEFVAQARAEVAAENDIDPSEVLLIRSEPVEWTSTALGCQPAPDDEVTQALLRGYRIELVANENRYYFHTDQQRMIRCDNPVE